MTIKRLQKFIFTVIIGILIVNILTFAPTNTPKKSDTIKGVWLTHIGIYAGGDQQLKSLSEIEKQVKAVEQLGYGYSIFCWEHTSILLRKIIYLFRQV